MNLSKWKIHMKDSKPSLVQELCRILAPSAQQVNFRANSPTSPRHEAAGMSLRAIVDGHSLLSTPEQDAAASIFMASN